MIQIALPRRLPEAKTAPNATLRAGLYYEARVSRWLEQAYNFHPQIEFEKDNHRFRPDGLLFSPNWDRLCVVEIKSQHSQEAVHQVLIYQSLLCEWFAKPVQALIITQTYRPELTGPLVPHIDCITKCCEPVLGVFAVNARYLPRKRGLGMGNGPGMGKQASEPVVRPSGGARHGADSVLRRADVVAPP